MIDEPHMSHSPTLEPMDSVLTGKGFWLALALMEVFVFAVHLNGLRVDHAEGDEVIFTFLAERLAETPSAYHLQGKLEGDAARRFIDETWEPLYNPKHPKTKKYGSLQEAEVLKTPPDEQGRQQPAYDPDIYDQPYFFHPPLYPYSLAAFRTIFGSDRSVLLSAMCHGVTIFCLSLLGRLLVSDRVGLYAAGLGAVEAVSWICGDRLWIDGMLEATVVLAALAGCWSATRGGAGRFLLAGVCLGLAGLSKLPAGLLAPAIVAAWIVVERKPKFTEMVAYVLGCCALIGPWMILTKVNYGAFLPSARPTAWLIERYPYVKMIVNRPALYYLVGLLLASPIFFYVPIGLSELRRRRWVWIPTVWATCFVAVLTVMGMNGLGFQLRYLAPAMPALCLLSGAGLATLPWAWRIPVLPLGAYTLYVGVGTGASSLMVDPVPISIAKYLSAIFGWNIQQMFPGMW